MKLDDTTNQVVIIAYNEAKLQSHEFVTPEHILAASIFFDVGKRLLVRAGGDIDGIQNDLQKFFDEQVPKISEKDPVETAGVAKMFQSTSKKVAKNGGHLITVEGLFVSFYELEDAYVVYILEKNGVNKQVLFDVAGEKPDKVSTASALNVKMKDEVEMERILAYVTDMTDKAARDKYDPLIGRDDIIERTEQVLLRRTKNNPIHVGEAGVGKSAIVEGIATRISRGATSNHLLTCQIFHLDLAATLAGTRYRGDFEDRLKGILDFLAGIDDTIIYIDEISTIVGTGAIGGGGIDASAIIKPYLTDGKLRFVASATYEEYKKFIEKDKALARRFQKIEVPEPTEEEAVEILDGVKEKYGAFHNVIYPKKTLELAVSLSAKYINDKFLPDKAIDVIDEAGASIRMRHNEDTKRISITEKDIERTISIMAKIPEKTISSDEINKLKQLPKDLKKKVFGQDAAVDTVVSAIKRSRSGFDDGEKPVASLLFVGPTGVGKTEVAKTLASTLNLALLRFDMSEYQEKHSVSRLIGAPPGYVGFDGGGLLTEQVSKSPHSVLLLDEIEKAHPDILNVLLQVMDYGRLTDTNGKKVDFKNVIIIMTSNAGAKDINKQLIGFERGKERSGAIETELKRLFAPEFRNRLDEIVLFNSLTADMALKIADKEMKKLVDKMKEKSIKLVVSKDAVALVAKNGASEEFGAREIIRYADSAIKRKLVDYVLFGKKGNAVKVSVKNGEIEVV